MEKLIVASAALLSTTALAAPQSPDEKVRAIAAEVSPDRMHQTVERLVGFGTRHTLSTQTDPKRGIGAAVRWAEGEMKKLKLETLQTCDTVTKLPRVPTPTKVCNAVGIQLGTERPNDVVIITGHIDSRVTDIMNANAEEPGANDDGSGTAAVLEAARVLSKHKFPGTIVYAALSGEEQGLLGGKILADYAKSRGWNVVANLNNDIIGNSCGSDGVCNDQQVRVFSEGPRWQGHEELASQIRSFGGENDSPSRNISRFLDALAKRNPSLGIDVMQVWRNDRFGRGGDHTEFLNAGFPAVRFSVAVENYNQQHQDLRTENGIEYGDTIDKMDFPYLARVTKLNVAALAWLASAPPPPEIRVEGAVSPDTTMTIRYAPPASGIGFKFQRDPGKDMGSPEITFYCRRTDESDWSDGAYPCMTGRTWEMKGMPTNQRPDGSKEWQTIVRGVRVDDWIFGASATEHGFESPVASAVPGGAFKPYAAPPPAASK